MIRLFSAFCIAALGICGVFAAYYLPSMDMARGFYNSLPFYTPIAAFCLLSALVLKGASKPWIISIFLYIAAAVGGEFILREALAPQLPAKEAVQIRPEDFLLNGHPDSKKGLMSSSPSGIYLFGETLRLPAGYIGRNFMLISSNTVTSADFIRIEENRIFALNARTIRGAQTNTAQGMTELPLSFAFNPLYALWGEKNPQRLSLWELAGQTEVFQNGFLDPYRKTIFLAVGRYAATFLLLLISAIFGLSAAGRLDFSGPKVFGSSFFILFSFPAVSTVYYYMITLINALVNRFL